MLLSLTDWNVKLKRTGFSVNCVLVFGATREANEIDERWASALGSFVQPVL